MSVPINALINWFSPSLPFSPSVDDHLDGGRPDRVDPNILADVSISYSRVKMITGKQGENKGMKQTSK